MTYGELPDLIGLPGHVQRPALHCKACGCGGLSAHQGDYFDMPDGEEIVCPECGESMALFVRRVTLEPWSRPS